jgi:hypothetical protein
MTEPPAPEDVETRAWLGGRPVLFAYGLLGDLSAKLARVGFDYMGRQQDWLRRMGALPQVVAVQTGRSVAANAAVIGAALSAAGPAPALLVAHSKGGVEGLAALMDPAAAARCAGFIAFQSPFRGSPVADWVAGHGALHGAGKAALAMLGCGDGEAVHDLTTAVRKAWVAKHAAAVADLAARLPVVSCATVLEPLAIGSMRDLGYRTLVGALGRVAGPNDGLVPLSSTKLPGPVRHLEGTGGHVALVSEGAGRDPVTALRRALAALLAPASFSGV